MPFLERTGQPRLFYEIDDHTDPWKNAPSILLQHGYARSSKFWRFCVPYLSRFYKVIRLDLRGQGQSDIHFDLDKGINLDAYLNDLTDRLDHLETDPNPFALVTAAHLRTRRTKQDPQARYQAKRALVRLLYRRGWDRQRILDLFAVLDWMMRLPDVLERQLWQDIEQIEGETRMRYVTSVERLAIERGIQQGKLEGILEGEATVLERQLAKRFGPLSDETRRRLKSASAAQLELWAERILDAPNLAATLEDH